MHCRTSLILIVSVIFATGADTAASAAPANLVPIILPAPATPHKRQLPYIKITSGLIALTHVRIIDGTGAPPRVDRTLIIRDGKIASLGLANDLLPSGANIIDMTGYSALPGLVGMHDHMYYVARPNTDASGHGQGPILLPQMTFSAPRLYLAGGVTTLRTAGSVEPQTDLNIKTMIDTGMIAGPHMDVTGPYLEGKKFGFVQMLGLRDAADTRATVAYWADRGATSFKAYMNITRAELKAAIDESHRRGLKITGHLCSVTYPEAIALGIDNLEHGFWPNTQNDPGKTPDICPKTAGIPTLTGMKPDSAAAKKLIAELVSHHVALTSTLPVFEQYVPGHASISAAMMDVLSPQARDAYLFDRNAINMQPADKAAEAIAEYQSELALERAFAQAGGILLAGPDPTGNGGVIPGFGDQREIELLVEAGFTPLEAIKIGTLNGATYMGLQDRIGSIATGKDADLIIVRGDPSQTIKDIENVEIVFKDGFGYDSKALIASVRERYGQY